MSIDEQSCWPSFSGLASPGVLDEQVGGNGGGVHHFHLDGAGEAEGLEKNSTRKG
jgi:hypothetical protein